MNRYKLYPIYRRAIGGQQGLTIIELMVAMLILIIVLMTAFVFFGYGVNAFNLGEKRTLVQANTRLASAIITDEIRYAENVIVHSTKPAHVKGVKTIYLDASGSIVIRDEAGSESVMAGEFAEEVTFTALRFNVDDAAYKTLFFSVTAVREGEQAYTLQSEVAPLNQKGRIGFAGSPGPGTFVTYTLMPPVEQAALNVSPRRVFEKNGMVEFTLTLLGDTFKQPLNINHLSLDGIIKGFALSNLIPIDDKTARITITGNYVEGKGRITVDGTALQKGAALATEIEVTRDFVFIEDDIIPDGMVGVEYLFKLTAVNGQSPYKFRFIETTNFPPPNWLTLGADGTLRGTPVSVASDIKVKVQVEDSANPAQSDAREFTFSVKPLVYNLSIGIAGNGTGTVTPLVGNYLHAPNTIVTISADAGVGSRFVSWSGEVANPTANSTTVVMDKNKLVIANFARTLTRLSAVSSGSYIRDSAGNLYIKLTGASDRVLAYRAGTSAQRFEDFNSNLMPERAEILNWSNALRREPDGKEYWTRTLESNNEYYIINSSGAIVTLHRKSSAHLRAVATFPGAFILEKKGTIDDPHLLVTQ